MRASQRFINRPIQTHQTDAAEPFFAPTQQSDVQAESEDSFFSPAPQSSKGEFAGGTVQTKLSVNAPGDKHEQEADAMADQVVQRMSAPEEKDKVHKKGKPEEEEKVQRMSAPEEEKDKIHKKGKPEEEEKVQRMSAPEEEKDKIHKKGKPEEEEKVQRKCAECEKEEGGQVQRQSDGSSTAPSGVTQQINSSKGQGSKLSDDTRTQMESSFGTDFSNVTIHTDHESTEMNNALHAQAFTHGSDIYFNEGKYNPQNTEGGRLLAHELTHVVQQGEGDLSNAEDSKTEINKKEQSIQRACGSSIAAATCIPESSEPIGEMALFRNNCDDFSSNADRQIVENVADSMTSSDSVKVHGFASIDGPADFNERLSCSRANRAADVLRAKGIPSSQMTIIQHGPTPGPARIRRSVVLETSAAVSRPVVPQLSATVVNGPNANSCGVEAFQVQWGINRNSGSNGGFVVQDLTIERNLFDCSSNQISFPSAAFPNPIRYFEAWRVQPNSTAFDPSTNSLDNFNATPDATAGCSFGTITFTATAHYFDNLAALPAHMVPNNPSTFAGSLPSSLTEPLLAANQSRAVVHNLTFHWDCCTTGSTPACISSPTIIDNHTP